MREALTELTVAAILLAAIALTPGCVTVNVKAVVEPEAGLGLEPGDRVVALWQDGFWEATVITVQGKLVTVAWDQPPPTESRVPRGWVQRMDAHPAQGGEARWLLCPGAQAWQLCHREAEQAERLTALSTEDRRSRSYARDEVLVLPEAVGGWAARYGQRVLEQLAFQEELSYLVPAAAGQPVAPEAPVIARWTDGNWWSGTVQAVAGNTVTVAWSDGSPPSQLPIYDVAPLGAPVTLWRRGDFAFCHLKEQERWWQARVEAAGKGRLEVTYSDGTLEAVAPSSCVAARARPAS